MSNTAEEIKLSLKQRASKFLLDENCGDVILNGALYENKNNWKYVSDMLIKFHKQRLTTVKEKAEQIKEKCLELSFDERDDMEGVISEIDVKLCFNEILQRIEEELQ